ncbi:MAG: hypothetical protein HYR90_02145 [Candidatus Andersenbacteria bacterium]|nr:hypothetical protein [Candidatus Andersenbacteria bacterium]MBI3250962.1 hypothetical protein [Candidatus Andersenbacteria bacterium]
MASFKKQGLQQVGGRVGRRVAKFIAGRTMFLLLLLASVTLSGIFVWQRAVSSLLEEPIIPADQVAATVQLSTQELQSIIERRAQRINFTPRSFARFNRLFPGTAASPSTSPIPSPSPTVSPAAG